MSVSRLFEGKKNVATIVDNGFALKFILFFCLKLVAQSN